MSPVQSATNPLSGDVALVTGASRGIGRSIAIVLAKAGAHVGLAARDLGGLEQAAEEIRKSGGSASVLPFDVADVQAADDLIHAVERVHGPLDLLVNNAGINGDGIPFASSNMDHWWRVFEINVRGPAALCRAALPGMIGRRSGRIVNVSSGLGNVSIPSCSDYSATKAALTRLTESIAVELSGSGVFVFAISPGMVRTDMTRNIASLRDLTDWDAPEAAGSLCVAIASGSLDKLAGRFFGVREGIDALIASTDKIVEQDMHVLRMTRIPTQGK
jgi:NAD(P)-dependent dehydrogenase (short-subunit alcohol dehydrogenase family)